MRLINKNILVTLGVALILTGCTGAVTDGVIKSVSKAPDIAVENEAWGFNPDSSKAYKFNSAILWNEDTHSIPFSQRVGLFFELLTSRVKGIDKSSCGSEILIDYNGVYNTDSIPVMDIANPEGYAYLYKLTFDKGYIAVEMFTDGTVGSVTWGGIRLSADILKSTMLEALGTDNSDVAVYSNNSYIRTDITCNDISWYTPDKVYNGFVARELTSRGIFTSRSVFDMLVNENFRISYRNRQFDIDFDSVIDDVAYKGNIEVLNNGSLVIDVTLSSKLTGLWQNKAVQNIFSDVTDIGSNKFSLSDGTKIAVERSDKSIKLTSMQ